MSKVVQIGIDVGCKRNDDIVRDPAQTLVETVNEITVEEVLSDRDDVRTFQRESEEFCHDGFDDGEQVVDYVNEHEIVNVDREVVGQRNLDTHTLESAAYERTLEQRGKLRSETFFEVTVRFFGYVAFFDGVAEVEFIFEDSFEQ